jgi:hypothetical protein
MAFIDAAPRFWRVHRLWGQYSIHPRYNRIVRLISCLLLLFCLVGCQHGGANNADAVRQGVIDHLAKANYNVAGMDVTVAGVQYNGEQAEATVLVAAKGQTGAQAMSLRYRLEHQNGKWVVTGLAKDGSHGADSDPNAGATNPHGGAMPPAAVGADNPHGAMPPAGGGAMPSPTDLPPAKKK